MAGETAYARGASVPGSVRTNRGRRSCRAYPSLFKFSLDGFDHAEIGANGGLGFCAVTRCPVSFCVHASRANVESALGKPTSHDLRNPVEIALHPNAPHGS